MKEFNIIDFLRTGELSDFPFGTSIDKFTSTFGNNPGWTIPISNKDKRVALIKYDQTEFYFGDEDIQKLIGLMFTYSEPADKKMFQFNYLNLKEQLTYSEIMDFLSDHNIKYKAMNSKYDSETKVITTESNVTFYFQDNNLLQKFGIFLSELD